MIAFITSSDFPVGQILNCQGRELWRVHSRAWDARTQKYCYWLEFEGAIPPPAEDVLGRPFN
jgi:hypothetical protein